MTEAPTPRYIRSSSAKLKQVGDSKAVYVRHLKALHVLNPTAELLFEFLAEAAGFDDLVAMLEEATDGSRQEIEADLAAALERFVAIHIVERVE